MTTNNSVNGPFPLSATQGGLGVASPTAHGILVAEGASPATPLVLTNGQLLIGSTGADPVPASITAGAGIIVTPGAGTLTIAATNAITWTDVTGTSQAIAVDNGYSANNAALVTLTLPATAAIGDFYAIYAKGAGLFKIAQNAAQSIQFGNQTTTSGTGGSLQATLVGDYVLIRCVTTNTGFAVMGSIGNITVV
jgi:hypothetical protein